MFIDALLPVVQAKDHAKILVIHATPTRLCSLPDLQATECLQAPISSFANLTSLPYFLPFDEQSCDAIVLQGVLDNALDVSRVIFESKRLLKPAGTLVLDGTTRTWATWLRLVLFQRLLQVEPLYYRSWRLFVTPSEIERVLQAYKFDVRQSEFLSTSVDVVKLLQSHDMLRAINVEKSKTPVHYVMTAVRHTA